MLWATPIVALSPLWLGRVLRAWPTEWRFSYGRETNCRASCQSNLKQLGLAFEMYSQDNGDKLPPATIGGLRVGDSPALIKGGTMTFVSPPVGWTGALLPYTRAQSLQFCPSQLRELNQSSTPSESRSPTSRGFTDYWLNARLARRAASSLSEPSSTFLLGEGNDGRDLSNATYSKASLPPDWLSDTSSPLFRHLGRANFLFADGHVKSYTPGEALHVDNRPDPFAP